MAQLFGFDFSAVFDAIKTWLGPVGKLFDQVKLGVEHTIALRKRTDTLVASILAEAEGWKNFKQDIRIKQRVVQIERAISKTRALIEGIPASWKAIQDLWKETAGKFKEISGSGAAEEAEAIAADVESTGVKGLAKLFPRLGRASERLLGVVFIIVDAIEQASNIIDDLQTIVDELKRLRLEFEKLDTVFLPQSNKRRRVRLADGSTIRIRVGSLHS